MLKTSLMIAIQEDVELLTDEESVEKTLSIIELIQSGGVAGQLIIMLLFVLLMVASYIYFERLFAIKAAWVTKLAVIPDARNKSERQ